MGLEALQLVMNSEMAGGEGGRRVMSVSHAADVEHRGERAGYSKSHCRGLPRGAMGDQPSGENNIASIMYPKNWNYLLGNSPLAAQACPLR